MESKTYCMAMWQPGKWNGIGVLLLISMSHVATVINLDFTRLAFYCSFMSPFVIKALLAAEALT